MFQILESPSVHRPWFDPRQNTRPPSRLEDLDPLICWDGIEPETNWIDEAPSVPLLHHFSCASRHRCKFGGYCLLAEILQLFSSQNLNYVLWTKETLHSPFWLRRLSCDRKFACIFVSMLPALRFRISSRDTIRRTADVTRYYLSNFRTEKRSIGARQTLKGDLYKKVIQQKWIFRIRRINNRLRYLRDSFPSEAK